MASSPRRPPPKRSRGGKLHRIGYLSAYPRLEMAPYTGAFRQTLRELGWVEGQRVIIEERFAEGALERLSALAADLVRPDSLFLLHRARLADLALKSRLPSVHWVRQHVEAGGLNLPVEQPTKFELAFNLTTAKALGLTIPQSSSCGRTR